MTGTPIAFIGRAPGPGAARGEPVGRDDRGGRGPELDARRLVERDRALAADRREAEALEAVGL